MLFNFLQYAPRDRRFTIRVGSILEAYRQQMLNYQQEELSGLGNSMKKLRKFRLYQNIRDAIGGRYYRK